ncbi:AgmX/PglI C-terminal domain-containing protein [Myxococcota bacterium]
MTDAVFLVDEPPEPRTFEQAIYTAGHAGIERFWIGGFTEKHKWALPHFCVLPFPCDTEKDKNGDCDSLKSVLGPAVSVAERIPGGPGISSSGGLGLGGRQSLGRAGPGPGSGEIPPYSVTPGRTTVNGCLARQVVGRVLARVQNQVRYCYEKELLKKNDLSGDIAISFKVASTGSVLSAETSASSMKNEAVETCLNRIIQRLRFPPCASQKDSEIVYPLKFRTTGK